MTSHFRIQITPTIDKKGNIGKIMRILADMFIDHKRVEIELTTKSVEAHSILTEHAQLINRKFLDMTFQLEKEINELVKRDSDPT